MRQTVRFLFDQDTGLVWSRRGADVAVPVLQWDAMGPENKYAETYKLERVPMDAVAGGALRPIRSDKVPESVRRVHCEFWGVQT